MQLVKLGGMEPGMPQFFYSCFGMDNAGAELVALKWSGVDLSGDYIEIGRVKHGHDTVHPLRAPELRALPQIRRDYPDTPYIFVSEPKTPLSIRVIRHIIARADEKAGITQPVHPHQLPESLWLLFG
ncbi:tyrosine-type recombinase/integrase [uncultured Nostoc sp.]|uniref:tyrosine-type recombinase/integrase n=1 Tax=uncultured Nostoc sp. TaxID=340711 RepID=UPI0035CBD09F